MILKKSRHSPSQIELLLLLDSATAILTHLVLHLGLEYGWCLGLILNRLSIADDLNSISLFNSPLDLSCRELFNFLCDTQVVLHL